ncbi:MAG: hypothetical protein PHC64_02205 [Candidatus Gastranaerophilales bacterium]|nr:hypothetical protein [Candidatus Gastranaerophilales bacterium]
MEKEIEKNLPPKAKKLINEFKGIGIINGALIYTELKGKKRQKHNL